MRPRTGCIPAHPRRSSFAGLRAFALVAAAATALAAQVRISEIHYHPAAGLDLEFVELENAGDAVVDLRGWYFSDGIEFAFTRPTPLEPGGRLLVAQDAAALSAALQADPARIAGEHTGRLDDSGERLALADAAGRRVDEVRYDDAWPFDASADGGGAALERVCLTLPGDAPFNWRAASPSPGRAGGDPVCPPAAPAADAERFPVVINEIYYHPAGEPEPPLEFIEIFNRGGSVQDLSLWSLDRGAQVTIPGGTMIAPGGFLLLARDPDAIVSRLGLDAARVVGPFTNGSTLSNSGEAVRLVNAHGETQDEVEYADAGAWPSHADGLGGSLQRVSALGASRAPGNWRVAPPPSPDDPGAGWRTFAVEGTHEGPRFYFYLLGAGEMLLDGVRLEVKDGDGATYIANGEFLEGLAPWTGTGNHAGSRLEATGGFGDNGACCRLVASSAGNGSQHALRVPVSVAAPGVRFVLTFKVRPVSGESRFVARSSLATTSNGHVYTEADARTGSQGGGVTPLAANNVGGPGMPASIEPGEFEPRWPTSRDWVAVRARVVASGPVTVTATHQAGTAPAAEVDLADDGLGADLIAGDGEWAAQIPPAPDRSLVWISLRATTASGEVTLHPPFKNPTTVTGYYVTDELPEQNDHLRLYYIFTPGALADLSCNESSRVDGDFVDFRGRAYRGVGVKFRGETACGYPKRPIRVEFTRGDRFDRQKDLNFNAGWNDKSMIREPFAFDFFAGAGVFASHCKMARVHTRQGAFHGAYFTVEDPSEEYLRNHQRDPDGALYKSRTALLTGGTAGLEARTDGAPEALAAVGRVATDLNRLNGQALIDFAMDNLDIDAIFDYQATKVVIIDGDSVVKNWLLYYGRHELESDGPQLLSCGPWDLDLSYGQMLLTTDVRNYQVHPLFQTQSYPFHDQGYHGIYNALLQRAPNDYFVKAYYGRMWRLLEEKFNPTVLQPRIDDFDAATVAAAREDLRKWPRSWGARGTDVDHWRQDHRLFVARRHEFLTQYLTTENPTTQGRRFQYDPAPRVKITEIHYNPPGQGQSLEFVEITSLEDEAVDIGAWTIAPLDYTFAIGSELAPRATLVVAKSPAALRSVVDLPASQVLGPYAGDLPGSGAILRLRDHGEGGASYPETIDRVAFGDDAPWPGEADGGGKSLELVAVNLDNDLPASWRAGWSPGRAAAANAAPVAAITATPSSGPVPLEVLLDASASVDPDGDALRVEWRIAGSGGVDTRPVLLIRFDTAGTHRVSLTVIDAHGAAGGAVFDVVVGPGSSPAFRRGDSNDTGRLDLSDAVFTLSFLFTGGPAPTCGDAADADDNGVLDISDAVYSLRYLFSGGPSPPAPGADGCGPDPSADEGDWEECRPLDCR